MFAFLRGELVTASREEAVVEVSGIGYRLHISSGTSSRLPAPGSPVLLYTHYHVREDLQQFFGFLDEEELQLFRLLVSISGVGPKLAMAVLSGLSVGEIQEAIVSNRPETLFGITGVGRKTAARIILELRDKILKIQPASAGKSVGPGAPLSSTQLIDDAVAALTTLGFPKASAQKVVSKVLEAAPGLSVEELVRTALAAMHNNS
ncbi:MAG TPA: Holliday junction branch migration protein RuvA [Chlorobaculum parvum]|uniref:Holliday junction branch migration complex subunit RuvA n=1 Tax=Chlorobaculum parvum TaxID=274539 RepID=A0A7C5HP36_9CHLB|nr:Holliday junction branch migration protein RuvA [Chlorobaculum parvum]